MNYPIAAATSPYFGTNPAFEYPTYKLDRNTVVDKSIKWERYSFPKQQQQQQQLVQNSFGSQQQLIVSPPPPPPPPLPAENPSKQRRGGTRL